MNRLSVSFALAAAGVAGTVAAQKPTIVPASMKVSDATMSSLFAPISEQVTLGADAIQGVAAPADLVEPKLGSHDLNGKKIAIIVGKSKAEVEQPDVLFVDTNADGTFGDGERFALETVKREVRGTQQTGFKPVDVELTPRGTKIPAKVSFMMRGEQPTATLAFTAYLEASADVGGEPRTVAVIDKDLDGKYGTPGDLWILGKAEGGRPAPIYALSALNERRFENGKLIGIAVEGADKIKVTTTDAKGPDPKDQASHRERVEHIWSARFDKEREKFVKDKKLDESRTKADKPIAWQYVTFDEGLRLAKEKGKPLFVDVMAFWCVWCYRMDYYTYPDAAVAALLNDKFIPVKLIEEQDPLDDSKRVKEKLEAKGIPAMGIFDGEGNLLHKIGGWKAPVDFIKDLETGLAPAAK